MKKVGAIALRLAGFLMVFDLLGVLLALAVTDSVSVYAYTIWFVFGIFFGLFGYNFSGGDSKLDEPDRKTGFQIILIGAILLSLLSTVFYYAMWQHGFGSDPYVPDSPALTAEYFIVGFLSMIAAHRCLRTDSSPQIQ